MTPKEKAEELFSTYRYALSIPNAPLGVIKDNVAKQCALIAVDELIKDNESNEEIVNGGLNKNYWQEVKQEVEKL